jgi:hypothetical protein
VEELVRRAKQKGFGALVINDHDRLCLEYGLPPFRNLIKKKVELNSINVMGADKYLQAIRESEKMHPDMVVIPGTESAPFYYWSGNPFDGSLTAHNYERRILTVGLDRPVSIRNLPLIHNRSPESVDIPLADILLIIVSIAAGVILLKWRGYRRWAGIAVLILVILSLFNYEPFKITPYDAYHGDQGIAPYQNLIDNVNREGGMTFWNYPETRSGVHKMGPIRVSTLPYPGVITNSKNYTGFAALYGDEITITDPGGLWDLALTEYCRGFRQRPPWAIATGDFHEETDDCRLGDFQTVFLVRDKTKDAILSALKNGKMYACSGHYPRVPKMEEFTVSEVCSPENSIKKGISGDDITISGKPRVRISISGNGLAGKKARIRLIRSGTVVQLYEGDLPAQIDYEDHELKPGETVYYRMDMKAEGQVVSNPIFVRGRK